jgi:hypothetical protein
MSFKLLLAMRHKDGQGWTEGYNYASVLGTVDPADVQNLANLRAAMLTTDCTITHARVGTSVKRLVQVVPLNGGTGVKGGIAPPTAPIEAAIMFVLQAVGQGYNRIFVRGFDSASVDGDTFTPSAAFNSAGGLWENFLLTSGLFNVVGFLGSSPTQLPLTQLTPLSPRGFAASSPGAIGPAGTIVTVHRAKVPGYNGRKTITVAPTGTGTTFQFGGAAPAVSDASTGVYCTVNTKFDVSVTAVNFEKVTSRKPGRPFGLSRGRAETLYTLR